MRQIFRCTLRRSPSSSLANDCITALAEGLTSSFYNHFLVLLWGDGDTGYLANANSVVDSEWQSFCYIIMQMCKKSRPINQRLSDPVSASSWEFLINSQFHKKYSKTSFASGITPILPRGLNGYDSSSLHIDGTQVLEKSFYSELLTEALDSLHAVYENLKLDNLRKR